MQMITRLINYIKYKLNKSIIIRDIYFHTTVKTKRKKTK